MIFYAADAWRAPPPWSGVRVPGRQKEKKGTKNPGSAAETIMSTVLREHVAIAQAAKLGQAAKLACKYANCQSGSG